MSIGDTHTWARVSIFLISLFAGLGLIRTIGNKTVSAQKEPLSIFLDIRIKWI